MKNLTQALSILFHPFWMPLAGTFVLLNYTQYFTTYSSDVHRVIYIIVSTSTIGLPMLMLPLYLYRKKFKGLELNERSERFVPLLVMTIFYFFAFYTLRNLNGPAMLNAYIFGVFAATLAATVANLVLKISLHGVGLGGLTALLFYIPLFDKGNTEFVLMQAFIITGLVFSARLYLQKHDIKQLLTGYAIGMATVFITLILLI